MHPQEENELMMMIVKTEKQLYNTSLSNSIRREDQHSQGYSFTNVKFPLDKKTSYETLSSYFIILLSKTCQRGVVSLFLW